MLTITGDIVTPGGVLSDGALTIGNDGMIAEVSAQRTSTPRSADIDASGFLVLPGFVDVHVHGGGGADFMHGTVDAVRQVARTHARFGTTSLLATTLTASRSATDAAITAARAVIEAGPNPDEARVIGIHLEGPYICMTKRGAQPAEFVRPPDAGELAHWVALSGSHIRRITLAPEEAGAEEVIKLARSKNITASVGHTNATAAEVEQAIGWGATGATHLFNAMRGLHHREPGTVGAALARPEIICEMIADGVHLDPLIVRLIVAAKGPTGAVLITDAIEGAAMPDGEYKLGGHPVFVQNGTAAFADGTLAGSVLTMNRAFANLRRYAPVTLPEAALLSSGNALRQLGLDGQFGAIASGKTADLVILHPETGEVAWTLVGGRVAYCR
ncbi:MAG: N-acetylglucosamine-6-phosphate deacetylase [Janthinobacterium lividum]